MFAPESNKYLICGLGNIGAEYADTRHNAGFLLADALALNLKAEFSSAKLGSLAKAKYKGRNLLILKPSTYMNLSGKALKYWMTHENIPVNQILVVVDDIALPTGVLRMKKKGGDAGHNGLNNIIYYLNSEEFPRLRIGVGNDFPKGSQVDYVLGRWTSEEKKIMIPSIEKGISAVKSFVFNGIDMTMNEFNKQNPLTI